MINKIAVALILLVLTGCATQPKVVYVPTPVKCPTSKIPLEPKYLPITKDISDADYVKAMTYNLKLCKDNDKNLRVLLDGYK